jgi:hypothetical protein
MIGWFFDQQYKYGQAKWAFPNTAGSVRCCLRYGNARNRFITADGEQA